MHREGYDAQRELHQLLQVIEHCEQQLVRLEEKRNRLTECLHEARQQLRDTRE